MKWRSMSLFALSMVAAGVVVAGGGMKAYGQFTYAIIADPHASTTAHRDKLQTAINYIIATKDTRNTKFAFVTGDVTWGGTITNGTTTTMNAAKRALINLNTAGIPYIPLIGDNEIHNTAGTTGVSYEAAFQKTFSSQYNYLANSASSGLTNWKKESTPVSGRYLENFSFNYGNCHFACADFASRIAGDESGNLNEDVTSGSGSWTWLKNDITTCAKPKNENINIITHIPMFTDTSLLGFLYNDYLFSSSQMSTITTFMNTYKTNIAANYAGHIHQNYTKNVNGIYTSYTTDETWDSSYGLYDGADDDITVRFVTVTTGATSMSYSQDIVVVDPELYGASLASVTAAPEPGALVLLALGLLSFGGWKASRRLRPIL
ncbi:MAG: hypothetical protein ABFC77_08965 [Thermoguttaceae bacterium]